MSNGNLPPGCTDAAVDEAWNADEEHEITRDHDELCHEDGSPCLDGCDVQPDPARVLEYLKGNR